MNVTSYSLVIILSFIVCRWIWNYWKIRKILSVVPGPSSLPFIGLSWKILSTPPEDRLQLLLNLCRKFKNGMVLIWLGTNPTIIINTPKYAELVLTNSKLITKSKTYDMAKPGIGNGLATSTGSLWVNRRKLVTPAFHFNMLEKYMNIVKNKVDILIYCLDLELQRQKNNPISIIEWMNRYAFDTICEITTGIDVDCQRKMDSDYVDAVKTYVELSNERTFQFWLYLDFVFYRTRKGKKFLKAIETMHQFTEQMIAQKQLTRRTQFPANICRSDDDDYGIKQNKVLLDLLLDQSENINNQLTLKDIREEMDTFLIAGHEPPAIATSWALFALGNAPEIQERIRDELRQVVGDQTNAVLIKHLDQLKYLDRVIKEVLRLYTVALFSGRQVENDIVIDGLLIPKGTTINIDFYQLHRNPEVWENPEKFDPDRFLPENVQSKSPYAYVPFSAGPRNCIAQKLAHLQLKFTLAAILRRWRIFSVLKPSEMKMMLDFTLRPHNETIELYFTPLKR